MFAFVSVLVTLGVVALNVLALGLIPERRRPSSATAWLLLILLFPVLGLVFFLLIGSPFVPKKRREEQRMAGVVIRGMTTDVPALAGSPDQPAWLESSMALNRRLGWLPATGNNDAVLFADYEESIAAMAAEILTAERYVHVEFYIMAWDATTAVFFEALATVAARGVKVRLLFDHVACFRIPQYKQMLTRLDAASIEWHPMLPIQPFKGHWRRPDLRNHRKILVVDGRSGFVGSQNMIDASYHNAKHEAAGRTWRELTTRVVGPVVHSFDLVFATDWYIETKERLDDRVDQPRFATGNGDTVCQVVPSGPGFPDENNLRLFNTMIYGAQQRLSITSPYFVPDESLLYAVTTAAQRGVAVELFVGAEGDQFMVHHAQCSYYRTLLEAGVRIYLYPAPFVLHAKHFSVDDHTAVIGSSNMDIRSFALDFEISMMCAGADFVRRLREVEDTYRAVSEELTLDVWLRRPLAKRYVDNVMRLTSAIQ